MSDETPKKDGLFCEAPTERCAVLTFGTASFLNDMGSDIVFSIWPVFVTLLAGELIAPLIIGLIDGVGDLIVNISKGFSGFLSDKVQKRKPFIWSGYLAGASSRLFYGVSPTWHWLLPARILDRFGKLRGAPRDALIADVSSLETRGRNFGILRTLDYTGATVGVLITIAFVTFIAPWLGFVYHFDLLFSLRLLFIVAAIPTIVGATLIILKITDYRKDTEKPKFRIKGLSRSLVLFMGLSVIFALASFSYSLVVLYASVFIIDPAINPVIGVPVAYLIFTLSAALTSAPMGKLGDRVGRRIILLLGFILFGVMCFIFLYTPSLWTILFALIIYGASLGATIPMQRSLVSELSPLEVRASILGLYQMLIGLAALPASLIAGLLWVLFGPQVPFLVALVLTFIAAIMLGFVREVRPSSQVNSVD